MSFGNEELIELQKLPLPRCGPLFVKVRDKGAPDFELDIFNIFLPPAGGCVNCGAELGGMFGSFSWGLAWGEGSCSCGYPGRAHHTVKLPDGTEDVLTAIMQYHPDELKVSEDPSDEND